MISASKTGGILHNSVQLDKSSIRVEPEAAHEGQHKNVHAQLLGLLYPMIYKSSCEALALMLWMHGDIVKDYGYVRKDVLLKADIEI